jgi:hypothetical protein
MPASGEQQVRADARVKTRIRDRAGIGGAELVA